MDGVLRDWLPAAGLFLLSLTALVAFQLTRPGVDGQFLVLADPRRGPLHLADIAWRAGGGLIRDGAVPGTGVALSDGADFADRLRAEGAWLVLPSGRALGCASGGEDLS